MSKTWWSLPQMAQRLMREGDRSTCHYYNSCDELSDIEKSRWGGGHQNPGLARNASWSQAWKNASVLAHGRSGILERRDNGEGLGSRAAWDAHVEWWAQRLQSEAGARISGSCAAGHTSPRYLGSFGRALAGSDSQRTPHCTCVALRVLSLALSPSELALFRNPVAATEP